MKFARIVKSAPVRKGLAALKQVPRRLATLRSKPEAYSHNPPVFVNSFPKSGTHLLRQVIEALPGKKDYGTFWASLISSIQFRERTRENTIRMLRTVAPGELVTGHLFYDPAFAEALQHGHVVHFLIYRDPRDVVLSEAHYLGEMNRWHRLHPYFKGRSLEERVSLAITGLPPQTNCPYPNLSERFDRFSGWLEHKNVCSVRFEDLVDLERRSATVEGIVQYYCQRADSTGDCRRLLQAGLSNIEPRRSHTFRQGKSGNWRTELTPANKERLKEVAGELLIRLGYERDHDW